MHSRTSNPTESAFSTVRRKGKHSRNCGLRETTLAMVFKLLQSAEKRWRRIQGFRKLEMVVNNVAIKDSEPVIDPVDRDAA